MFLIHCPHCGESRAEEEFHAAGEAHLVRPAEPLACSDAEWGDYLYFRDNPRGEHRELWVHAAGCRKHFNVARDTVSYAILGTYRVGERFETSARSDAAAVADERFGAANQVSGATADALAEAGTGGGTEAVAGSVASEGRS